MQNDLIGYGRAKLEDNHLISSDYAAMFMQSLAGSSGRLGLVQNSAISYGHRVEPRFEGGSSELFWVSGQPRGTMQAGRVIGNKGALNQLNHHQPNDGNSIYRDLRKAVLRQVDFKLATGKAAQGDVNGDATVSKDSDVSTMQGCVVDSLQIMMNTGGMDVSETFSMQMASLKKGRVS